MEDIIELAAQVAVLIERSEVQEKMLIKLEHRIEEYLKKIDDMIKLQTDKFHKFDLRLWIIVFIMATASGGASSILLKLLG